MTAGAASLKRCPLFQHFDSSHLEILALLASRMQYQKADVNFREDDVSSVFYGIVSGTIALEDDMGYFAAYGGAAGTNFNTVRFTSSILLPLRDFEVSGDVGVNHNTNDQHIVGATHTGFEGRVKVAIEPRWSISFQ